MAYYNRIQGFGGAGGNSGGGGGSNLKGWAMQPHDPKAILNYDIKLIFTLYNLGVNAKHKDLDELFHKYDYETLQELHDAVTKQYSEEYIFELML